MTALFAPDDIVTGYGYLPSLKSGLDFLVVPSNVLLLLSLAGFVLLCLRKIQFGRVCVGVSVAGFMVFGYTSAGEVLFAPLASRFPPHDMATDRAPFGLIVLHSGVNEVHAARMGTMVEFDEGGGEPVLTAALLARRFPAARVVVGGGTPVKRPLREADGIQRILTEFDVDPTRIAIDGDATSTVEAVGTILTLIGQDRDQDWWLITAAHRMPRAMGTFRQMGFEPVPVPVDFRWVPPFDPTYVYALQDGMRLTDEAVHEWLGLLVYRVMGRTGALFPAPWGR